MYTITIVPHARARAYRHTPPEWQRHLSVSSLVHEHLVADVLRRKPGLTHDQAHMKCVTWNVVWFGIMSEMVSVWCGMMQCKMWWNDVMKCEMQWQCVTFHVSPPQLNIISHQTTFPAQHTGHISHITLYSFTYFNTTRSHGVMWNSVVWNLVWYTFCNATEMWDAVPYSS